MRILYVYEERIPEKLRDIVRGAFPTGEFELQEITYTAPESEWIEKFTWAEGIMFAPGRFVADSVLEHGKHLKLMQVWSSGYDKFNVAGAAKYAIPLANNGGANACSVAEHTVLLMLSVYKWLPDSHRRTITGTWAGNSHGLDMFLLYQKTIGIIGFGNIGRYVAKKLSGFEASVKYFDIKRASPEDEKAYGVSYASFEEILQTSDIVSLHLHYNKATEGIIGKKEIETMKNGSTLINVSRAQLVDQDALYDALKSGKLHGAGMDVYMKEPTTGEEPILKLPNVVSTPHMAGSTYDTYKMVMDRCVENFRRVARGENPLYLVTPSR